MWLETLAIIFTVGMFISTVPQTLQFLKTKTTGNASIFPYLATFINCSLWCKYGILVEIKSIFIVNFIGLIVSIGSIYVFAKVSMVDVKISINLTISFVFLVYVYSYFGNSTSITGQIGFKFFDFRTISSLFSIIMFASPLLNIVFISN
jgi:solute carrier family 50 protein (sugar transporter)